MTLKQISKAGVAAALQKAEKYRLLNEPEQAESICRDILAVEPQNQEVLWLKDAMAQYERAEGLAPSGNDEAKLRWNACARTIEHEQLQDEPELDGIDEGDSAPNRR